MILSFRKMSLKTFIIVVTVMAAFHTTESSSNNIHQPSSSGHHGYNASPHPSAHPTWFVFNNATNQRECGDDLGGVVTCDSENKRIHITSCYCMSEDEHFGPIVGSCSTNCYIPKTNCMLQHFQIVLPPSSKCQRVEQRNV